MDQLQISLFGRFGIEYGADQVTGCEACKVQELLSYLLIHRDRTHARETLASILWGDHCTTAQSKKYLRKALWQLQAALSAHPGLESCGLLLAEPDWIQLRSIECLQLDVEAVEAAYASVKNVPGRDLDDPATQVLEEAVRLYTGDLLEGWYQDWCLYERERLNHIYLILLDKLTGYCEARRRYEAGLGYGACILRYDRARERTHQQLMRLHYLAGDRTGALRQYAQCVTALREELNVGPARSTTVLYQQICEDRLIEPKTPSSEARPAAREVLFGLQKLQANLADLQQQVRRMVKAVEAAFGDVSFTGSEAADAEKNA